MGGKKSVVFEEANPDSHFWAISGAEIKSIYDLAYSVERMSDDAYYYHVTDSRNDFSRWVSDVFKQQQLADDLRRAHGRLESAICLFKFIIKDITG